MSSRTRALRVATFIGLTTVITCCSPLRRSELHTRSELLKSTPVGMADTRVLSIVRERYGGRCWAAEHMNILEIPWNDPVYSSHSARSRIMACIGEYWPAWNAGPFTTGVFAEWYFDADRKLVEIRVAKEVDSL